MVHCGQFNCLQGDSLELRRLKPDPLNLLVNTNVGSNVQFYAVYCTRALLINWRVFFIQFFITS